jgi:putative hydrolase of the HAD superfamily
MVGDNLAWDIEAPQKLGIYAVWNDYDKAGLPKNTTVVHGRIIHSISELLDNAL